jgi:acetate kinase
MSDQLDQLCINTVRFLSVDAVQQANSVTRVLVLNTGSSSVKWTVLAADKAVLAGGSEPWAADDSAARADQLRAALKRAPRFDAAGHRVVHGGTRFREAVVIDESVLRAREISQS